MEKIALTAAAAALVLAVPSVRAADAPPQEINTKNAAEFYEQVDILKLETW